jgi:hypothetical protein
MLVKKSVAAFTMVACAILVMTSAARATIVDANEEWLFKLYPGETVTSVVSFIPEVPGVMDTLLFPDGPDWTLSYPFDYVSFGWDTAISADNGTAYLYGPAITNDTGSVRNLFSYTLYYQWDDTDPNYNANYPVYIDIVVFNDQEVVRDGSLRGFPNGPWDDPCDVTWREQYYPESPPYENPVPEPVTFGIFGLGALFLRRKRS